MDLNGLCELALKLGCSVKYDEPLSEHCSFRVGGKCRAFIEAASADALSALIIAVNENRLRAFVLGKGSNVIFDDRGFNGAVIHISPDMSGISLIDDETVFAESGASLNKLCLFALENSLSGLEFAYGIPGSVGGAVFMNAGAYGGEIKDVIVSAKAVDKNGRIFDIAKDYMGLSYRHSSFMENDMIITSAVFKLRKADSASIRAQMDELIGRRKDKQPLEFPSAGSTFKRPEGQFAGKLIQDCGLRGYTIGGAQVSEKHCGFVINRGSATSKDILNLIDHIQRTVLEKTGTALECEVRYIPYE